MRSTWFLSKSLLWQIITSSGWSRPWHDNKDKTWGCGLLSTRYGESFPWQERIRTRRVVTRAMIDTEIEMLWYESWKQTSDCICLLQLSDDLIPSHISMIFNQSNSVVAAKCRRSVVCKESEHQMQTSEMEKNQTFVNAFYGNNFAFFTFDNFKSKCWDYFESKS